MGSGLEQQEHVPTPWWCYALLVAAVLSAASAGVAFTWMAAVPPFTLAAWRLQLTSVIAMLFAVLQWRHMAAEQRSRAVQDAGWSVFSGCCLAVHFGAWVWSLQHTSMAHSVLLVCTAPVILVAAAVLLGQPISAGEVVAALLAVAGCGVLTVGAAAGKEQQVTVAGDLAAFSAAIAVVAHWHAGKLLRSYQPVFVYSGPVTLLAAVLLSLLGFAAESRELVGSDHHGVFGWVTSPQYAVVVVYLGCVPGIIGHQGFNTVIKYMSPLMVGLGVQFEPIIAPLLGWLLGLERAPGLYTWIGGAIVLVATAGASVATHVREKKAASMFELVTHTVDSQRMTSFTRDSRVRFDPIPEGEEEGEEEEEQPQRRSVPARRRSRLWQLGQEQEQEQPQQEQQQQLEQQVHAVVEVTYHDQQQTATTSAAAAAAAPASGIWKQLTSSPSAPAPQQPHAGLQYGWKKSSSNVRCSSDGLLELGDQKRKRRQQQKQHSQRDLAAAVLEAFAAGDEEASEEDALLWRGATGRGHRRSNSDSHIEMQRAASPL